MAHVFDAKKMAKLADPRRREFIPTEKILSIMNLVKGKKLLDLGCGIGYLTIPAAKAVGSEGFVFGLDIQEEMLVEALTRSRSQNLPQIAWVLSAPDYITLPTESVHYITMVMVAHEIPNLRKMLQECRRVLQPGGRIGIVEWNDTFTQIGPPLDHRLKAEDLSLLLQENGFKGMVVTDISEAVYITTAIR
ncbi:Methyltransferase type 11 [Desulforamulus reducens MI-1]|uniref:Methyltransferase type 11 n=1 Tax=Desulforamulus reducens (strain ATCC BAA-1160 / DSM 100696 / MI-1) TaxID=349161 RepID=A4J4G0_DESRM|nr:class I SAM-dependent methyltransferase [Desulforamulus reducens]ABO49963.1 Methyltransferase type 11 [Desulforamulus reducens MI-1]